jgi:hypothetical protein
MKTVSFTLKIAAFRTQNALSIEMNLNASVAWEIYGMEKNVVIKKISKFVFPF